MSSASRCPTPPPLEQFLLRPLTGPAPQELEVHLQHCHYCLERLAGLRAEDALVDAVRDARLTPAASAPHVDSLIDHLSALPPPRVQDHLPGEPPPAATQVNAVAVSTTSRPPPASP